MALEKSVNTYATAEEYDQYAALFGTPSLSEPEALLKRSTAYLDLLYRFGGQKTNPDQELEWPRNGSTTIPLQVTRAACQLAYMLDTGLEPATQPEPMITAESVNVAGAIQESKQYSQPYRPDQLYSVSLILGTLGTAIISNTATNQITAVRG